jgi:hypothetical protein
MRRPRAGPSRGERIGRDIGVEDQSHRLAMKRSFRLNPDPLERLELAIAKPLGAGQNVGR